MVVMKRCIYVFYCCVLFLVVIFTYSRSNLGKTVTRMDEAELKSRLKGPLKSDDPQLIDHIKLNYLTPPSPKPYNFSKSHNYKINSKALTWKFINEKLVLLFDDEPPGFFVEAGALDGEFLSNSLWLEMEKNWRGILIEPEPHNYKTLLKKNRKAWSSNSCVSTVPYPEVSVLSTIDPTYEGEGFENSNNWVRKGQTYEISRGFTHAKLGTYSEIYFEIQCFPLQSYLLALNVTVVDFLSLDIQGGEWEVLKLFPWKKFEIRTMVIEYYASNVGPGEYSQEFVDYIEQKGFVLLGWSEEPDYFFVHSKDRLLRTIKSSP